MSLYLNNALTTFSIRHALGIPFHHHIIRVRQILFLFMVYSKTVSAAVITPKSFWHPDIVESTGKPFFFIILDLENGIERVLLEGDGEKNSKPFSEVCVSSSKRLLTFA